MSAAQPDSGFETRQFHAGQDRWRDRRRRKLRLLLAEVPRLHRARSQLSRPTYWNALGPGSFIIKGGPGPGRRFVEALTLHSHVADIGDVRSLAIHPATTTHTQLTEAEQRSTGVDPGLVRLSLGLETIDGILADLDRGFAAAR